MIRRFGGDGQTSEYPFSGKLFCQNCGSKFRRQAWGSGKNKKYVWRCINREINGVESCSMKSIREKDLEQAFLRAMNKLISGKEAFLIEGAGCLNCVGGTEDIGARLMELQHELMSVVRSLGIDSEKYSKVVGEIENLRGRRVGLKSAEAEGAWRKSKLEELKAYLEAQGT